MVTKVLRVAGRGAVSRPSDRTTRAARQAKLVCRTQFAICKMKAFNKVVTVLDLVGFGSCQEMGGLKWAIWASGGSYNSLSHPLQNLPLTLAMSDDDEEADEVMITSWRGCLFSRLAKAFLSLLTRSKWAPWSRRAWITAGLAGLLRAAVCKAVLPSLSTALGSAPHSSRRLIAGTEGKTQMG